MGLRMEVLVGGAGGRASGAGIKRDNPGGAMSHRAVRE